LSWNLSRAAGGGAFNFSLQFMSADLIYLGRNPAQDIMYGMLFCNIDVVDKIFAKEALASQILT
jgi:hypothetical protein